jgi:hypothetical protein
MSRARPIEIDGEQHWFDTKNPKATDEQLELLSAITGVELDDLLDEVLTQGEVLKRLRRALGIGPIPPQVLAAREVWRAQRASQPKCRICKKEGDSTKHHFINKWILRELANYTQKWADRSKNCIPVCIHCHRDLHDRSAEAHSIADRLNDDEKRFAEAALTALAEERPKLLILIARGDDSVYEARLVKDWIEGKFRVETPEPTPPAVLRVVA